MPSKSKMSPSTKRGALASPAALLAAVLLAGGTLFFTSLHGASSATLTTSESMAPEPPTAAQVELTLMRAGLSCRSLTAAGVTPQEAATVFAAATAEAEEQYAALADADENLADARRTFETCSSRIRSGQSDENDVTARAQAATDIATAEAAVNAALAAIHTEAVASLSTGKKNLLATVNANSHWNLPAQYAVLDQTEAQWVQLRNALGAERMAAKLGTEPDQSVITLLTTINADSGVIAAKTALETNLASVHSAMTAAMAE